MIYGNIRYFLYEESGIVSIETNIAPEGYIPQWGNKIYCYSLDDIPKYIKYQLNEKIIDTMAWIFENARIKRKAKRKQFIQDYNQKCLKTNYRWRLSDIKCYVRFKEAELGVLKQ